MKNLWWKFIPLLLLGVCANQSNSVFGLTQQYPCVLASCTVIKFVSSASVYLSVHVASYVSLNELYYFTRTTYIQRNCGDYFGTRSSCFWYTLAAQHATGGRKRHTTMAFKLVMRLVFWILNTLGAPCVSIQSSYNSVSLQLVYLFSGMLQVEMAAGFTIVHKRDLKCKFAGEKFSCSEYFRKNVQT